jgi:hypothetical protein
VLNRSALVLPALLISACSTDTQSVFRRELEWDVAHGRGIDLMFLAQAKDFSHTPRQGENGETIWVFVNDKRNCRFEYVIDKHGVGIAFRFLSAEENCQVERKFSGW